MLFPMPEGVSWQDETAFVAWIKTLPQTALILVIVAHLGQAFFGGFVVAWIAKQNMMCVAMTVGVLTLLGGIMNMMTIPAPNWMWFEMPLYLVVAWLAGTLVMRMRSRCCSS